jgi:preprotein translocase subunit SecD
MKKRNLLVRVIIITVITLLGIVAVFGPRSMPTVQDFTWSGLQQNIRRNVNLGLDLRGGSHLVMRVKIEDYFQKMTENDKDAAFNEAKNAGLPVTNASVVTEPKSKTYQVILESSDPSKMTEISEAVKKKVDFVNWTESISGNTIAWSLPQQIQAQMATQAVEQAKRIIDSRINAVGVAEYTLQTHGAANSYQLLLQMPGIQDPERIKQLLSVESKLELVHVISPPSPAPVQTYDTEEAAKATIAGAPNRKVLPFAERDDDTETKDSKEQKPKRWVVIETPPVVDGSELRTASAVSRTGSPDDYQIAFSFKPGGAQIFGEWTGKNINQYMGVVLNNEVKSIAYIKSQIFDSGEISGRFTKQSAEDLALTLRSGSLPAKIEYQEERTVGPSLGEDSIRSGVTASVGGLIFVMIFMVFYYRGSGINAVIALLLNMLLTLGAMVWFGATLTLPGIAGLILGIGMAVDSNVLIFERIREELKAGNPVSKAVDLGFDRAFVTIIDTHITTIISSLLLFIFGTGPIRGFAVTLILGLLINLFSAVYVSRTIFIWLLNRKQKVETLSI